MACIISEAVFVGIAFWILDYLFGYALKLANVSGVSRFQYMVALGFLGHILFELMGLNSWYCKNGIACRASA